MFFTYSISKIRSGRRNVSSAARSIGSSAGDGASAGNVCTTHRTRTVRLSRSDRPCSSSTRLRSCQYARAKSLSNPITTVLPSIVTGSAFASCDALPTLCSLTRATISAQAFCTSASDVVCARRARRSMTPGGSDEGARVIDGALHEEAQVAAFIDELAHEAHPGRAVIRRERIEESRRLLPFGDAKQLVDVGELDAALGERSDHVEDALGVAQ